MTPSALMKQVKEAIALGEKHDLAMLEIPGVCKFIRNHSTVPRIPLTAEQQLERERAELAKSAAHSKRREAKVKEALDDFDRGGL